MTPLRTRMLGDLRIRNRKPSTQERSDISTDCSRSRHGRGAEFKKSCHQY